MEVPGLAVGVDGFVADFGADFFTAVFFAVVFGAADFLATGFAEDAFAVAGFFLGAAGLAEVADFLADVLVFLLLVVIERMDKRLGETRYE